VPQCKPFDSVTNVLGWTHYVIQYSESIGLHWSVSKLFSSATACVVQIATDLVLDMYHCIKNLLFIGHMITDDHKMQMTWRGQACTYRTCELLSLVSHCWPRQLNGAIT